MHLGEAFAYLQDRKYPTDFVSAALVDAMCDGSATLTGVVITWSQDTGYVITEETK